MILKKRASFNHGSGLSSYTTQIKKNKAQKL